jgi:hypothetical protein
MGVKVLDLDVTSVHVNGEFTISCPDNGYRRVFPKLPPSTLARVFDPLAPPQDETLCVHIDVEYKEGVPVKFIACAEKVMLGRSGFLCEAHLNGQQTATEEMAHRKMGYWRNESFDVQVLKEQLVDEIVDLELLYPRQAIGLHYKKYSKWGWASKPADWRENDSDWEEVDPKELL